MIELEGPPLPVPPPAIWGIWFEGDGDDPPGWSDLCPSEAEARRRLEAGVLPEHRHRYRVALAGVAPDRPAEAEAERDHFKAIIEHALRFAACDGDGAIDWDTAEDVLLGWMAGCEGRTEAIGEDLRGRLAAAEAERDAIYRRAVELAASARSWYARAQDLTRAIGDGYL
jgi:hypothetical protein